MKDGVADVGLQSLVVRTVVASRKFPHARVSTENGSNPKALLYREPSSQDQEAGVDFSPQLYVGFCVRLA